MRNIINNITSSSVSFKHMSLLDMCEWAHEMCGGLETVLHWQKGHWHLALVREANTWSFEVVAITPWADMEQEIKHLRESLENLEGHRLNLEAEVYELEEQVRRLRELNEQ